ncbi:MAG: hypothetical protein FJY15_01040 [Bacteroidetes bacterium]|nr:hypothetical protein [Bacteroidota bacterium]
MDQVRNITFQPNTNDCIVCGSKFVYKRQSMKYCSNACKCQAYQARQNNKQSIKGLDKTLAFMVGSRSVSKQNIVPKQTTKSGTSSIVQEQRQTINQQKAHIEHLHKQAEQFVQMVTYETNKQIKDALEQAKKAIAMCKACMKENDRLKAENIKLKTKVPTN